MVAFQKKNKRTMATTELASCCYYRLNSYTCSTNKQVRPSSLSTTNCFLEFDSFSRTQPDIKHRKRELTSSVPLDLGTDGPTTVPHRWARNTSEHRLRQRALDRAKRNTAKNREKDRWALSRKPGTPKRPTAVDRERALLYGARTTPMCRRW